MTPREFLDNVVRPNIADFHTNFSDLRYAFNAIASVDALAAHLYVWAQTNAQTTVASIKNDSLYRATLAGRNQNFRLLRDMAKAQKHVRLTQNPPPVSSANQVTTRGIGFGMGGFGQRRFGGAKQVVVDISPQNFMYVESIINAAVIFLESEMTALGV